MAALRRGRRGRPRRIALVGGLADRRALLEAEAEEIESELRLFASAREGGRGELRRLLASLKGGGIDEVWILCCWIGHSQSGAIVRACRRCSRRSPTDG